MGPLMCKLFCVIGMGRGAEAMACARQGCKLGVRAGFDILTWEV